MANISDAFGDIHVERVGKEFLEYLNAVQGDDETAYYKLVEVADLEQAKNNVDKNGDLSMSFSTGGRWHYQNNINGYLKGEWMQPIEAYDKFLDALISKDGVVDISYTDSDSAMDWMGTGNFRVEAKEGEIIHTETFDEQPITISGYADINGEDEYWALTYLKGEEIAEAYDIYVDNCKSQGKEAESPDVWYNTIYEEE